MSDLTPEEQTNVRAALQFLRARGGGWDGVAQMLRLKATTLSNVASGGKVVSPLVAMRVARFVKVGIDELLAGKFPEPGTCAHCGHRAEAAK